MDELDKRLCNDLSTEIPVPDKCEKVIRESLYNKEKIRKQHFYAITKIITTACASLLLSTGVVFAGYKIYEKIWKEPEKLTGFYTDDGGIITEQEKDKAMSEEEVKKIAMEKLEIFGHKDEKIEKINLQNSPDNTGLTWRIDTNKNTIITIDAENSSNYGISFKDTLDKNIEEYRTTEKEAIDTAKNFCIKYGYDTEEYDEVKVSSNMDSEKDSYIWYVDFYKEYDDIINPYECISIGFIPKSNELYYFIVEIDKYEYYQIQITEQQAIEIVTKEDPRNLETSVSDYADSEHLVTEIAKNYGLNPETSRIIMNPNFAIIYDVNGDKLRVGDLLFNTRVDNEMQQMDIENQVVMQIRLALEQIASDKEIDVSALDEKQKEMYAKVTGLTNEIDVERGVGHAR